MRSNNKVSALVHCRHNETMQHVIRQMALSSCREALRNCASCGQVYTIIVNRHLIAYSAQQTSSSAIAERPHCSVGQWVSCGPLFSVFKEHFCRLLLQLRLLTGMVKVRQDATPAALTGGSLHEQNLHLRGCPPPTICARIDRPVNALQLCC